MLHVLLSDAPVIIVAPSFAPWPWREPNSHDVHKSGVLKGKSLMFSRRSSRQDLRDRRCAHQIGFRTWTGLANCGAVVITVNIKYPIYGFVLANFGMKGLYF